jgi:hypothetical protein
MEKPYSIKLCKMGSRSQRFKDLCEGIRNNDPGIVEVEIPLGNRKGRHMLLKALQRNTHVAFR